MFFIAKEADFTLYRYVIFDLDGTLLNTLEDLAAAGEYVCAQNGWPAHTLDEYRYFVGNGIPKLCERFSPADQRSPERLAQTLEQFTRYYDAHKEDATAPYPGIEALRLKEAEVSIAVLSNKAHPLAKGVLEHYFPDRFAFVQGAKPGVPVKPDPAGLRQLMAAMGADPASTLFVGDSNVDIRTAKNGGLAGCGVLWGFRTEEELRGEGADHIAADPAALGRIILE